MTLRPRTSRPRSRATRFRSYLEGEERQQFAVTVLFAVVIGATILILLGAVGLAWYNDNLRPLGRVGSVEIGPQFERDRLELELWRIQNERNRATAAQISGEIDQTQLSDRISALDQRAQDLQTAGIDGMIDLIYQSQLAEGEGITVTDADVDARVTEEFAGIERRHVLAIFIKPANADAGTPGDSGSTASERRAALDRAQEALGQLESGREFADVAREFSTDPSALNGGDFGNVSEVGVPDSAWGAALFKVGQGETTEIVRGSDGTYRIGKVLEITPAAEEPGLRQGLLDKVSEGNLQQIIRYQIGAERLNDKIVNEALAQTPDQLRIAIIYVAGLYSGDPEDAEGEVDYSEIVFAPNDELETAPDLSAEDPAWETARSQAQTAYDELLAVTDTQVREDHFKELATSLSDSPTKDDAGAVGFVTRGIPPDAIGAALFDTTHQAGELIGPVKADAGYYVILFHERRASPEDRVKAVEDALAVPGADFNEVARQLSDGPEKDDGGEVGWLTRDQLSTELADQVFALAAGQISDPLELGEGHYIVKIEERGQRALDPDQVPDVSAAAFDNWYTPKRDAAEADGTIIKPVGTDTTDGGVDPGLDTPTQ